MSLRKVIHSHKKLRLDVNGLGGIRNLTFVYLLFLCSLRTFADLICSKHNKKAAIISAFSIVITINYINGGIMVTSSCFIGVTEAAAAAA